MPPFTLTSIPEKEIVPGFHARFVHTDNLTLAYWRIEAGSSLPAHSHPHEQVTNLLEGEIELVVDGAPHRLTPGQGFVIPGNLPHGGKALTACRILDIFHPVREDYKQG